MLTAGEWLLSPELEEKKKERGQFIGNYLENWQAWIVPAISQKINKKKENQKTSEEASQYQTITIQRKARLQ